MSVIYIIILFFVCMILYKPGFKFFMLWSAICAGVFFLLNPSAGIWGLFIYCFMGTHDESSAENSNNSYSVGLKHSSESTYTSETENRNTHRGTSYRSGDVTYYPNGNFSTGSGNITYCSNKVRSVKNGNVTYYFDRNDHEIGRSVDNGNGVHTYFDTNNREIGHSYTSGRITDFVGECFWD